MYRRLTRQTNPCCENHILPVCMKCNPQQKNEHLEYWRIPSNGQGLRVVCFVLILWFIATFSWYLS